MANGKAAIQAILPNIPLPDKVADVVSLIEVIEHLHPDDVEPALRELSRLSKDKILLSAAVMPHYVGGVNLHPSARSYDDWEKVLHRIYGAQNVQIGHNLGSSPCWVISVAS
jgi:ubiquinone/menaquinone biosynthesis C-methylase UbiE